MTRITRSRTLFATLCTAAFIAGCATPPSSDAPASTSSSITTPDKSAAYPNGGGYYKDDGPGKNPPPAPKLQATPDPLPRIEPLAKGSNRPYTVFGKRYIPMTSDKPFHQEGRASWYGKKFHGRLTSNGERYDMYAMTAAHPTMPIPSYARVTSKETGRSVIVRVNDRGPFHGKRIIDLSYTAALKLDLIHHGHGPVIVERITNDEILAMAREQNPATPTAKAVALASAADTLASDATPRTLPATPKKPVDNGDQRPIYLQVGAFKQRSNAQSLLKRIKSKLEHEDDANATVEQGDQLYRVKIGPYADRDTALSAVSRVASSTGIYPSLTER